MLAEKHNEVASRAFVWLQKHSNELEARAEQLAIERWKPLEWDEKRIQLARGLMYNRQFLKMLREDIVGYVSPDSIYRCVNSLRRYSEYRDFSFYLMRDWLGDPSQELCTVVREVSECIEKYSHQTGSAIVLGAGLGRLACELCSHFREVIAFEKSIIAAAIFLHLKNGFSYFHENFSNAEFESEQTASAFHIMPERFKEKMESGRLRYIVGDVSSLPFDDNSLDWVVSAFFSDVVGMDALLPDSHRVLKKGGKFMHIGPLHYHFSQRGRMFPVDMLRRYIENSGFSIVIDRFFALQTGEHKPTLMRTVYKCWILVAEKR